MTRGAMGTGELEFLQAFVKRGFVTIPRMIMDYPVFDYDTLGKLIVLLSYFGGTGDSAFGPHVVSRKGHPQDFDQICSLATDLEQRDIVRIEETGDKLVFTFGPLFYRLRVYWAEEGERIQQQLETDGPDPVLAVAQKLLGRPLSGREVTDIQDWVSAYAFDADMVQAVIREGQSQGVTRMTYLNQIARTWHEAGVRTPEEAEQLVQRNRKTAAKHKTIISYIGIKRQLTGAEQAMLDRWSEEWGFSNEVIMKACDLATGSQNPLQYANRVLENWRERGVKSVADAEQAEAEHKRRSVAAASDSARGGARPARNQAPRSSNVFLKREKKDDTYYDQLFKKLDE